MKDLKTVKQYADYVGLSVQRIYALMKKGQLKYKLVGGKPFIKAGEIAKIGKVGRPSKK